MTSVCGKGDRNNLADVVRGTELAHKSHRQPVRQFVTASHRVRRDALKLHRGLPYSEQSRWLPVLSQSRQRNAMRTCQSLLRFKYLEGMEALRGTCACVGRELSPIPRWGSGLQGMHKFCTRHRNSLDRRVERRLVRQRRLIEPTDLADELQGGRADLVVGNGGREVEQQFDVATHTSPRCFAESMGNYMTIAGRRGLHEEALWRRLRYGAYAGARSPYYVGNGFGRTLGQPPDHRG